MVFDVDDVSCLNYNQNELNFPDLKSKKNPHYSQEASNNFPFLAKVKYIYELGTPRRNAFW